MASDSDVAAEAAALLARQFASGEGGALPESERLTLADLRQYVAGQVRATLARNPALMMSILYRVDVAEADAKRILTYTEPAEIPYRLADLLIERQMLKLRIRRAYSTAASDSKDDT